MLVRSDAAAVSLIEEDLNAALPRHRPVAVLEAGCGRAWTPVLDPEIKLSITGVDVDAVAMAARDDLDAAVVGDLRDPDVYPRGVADLVFSAFVLEHIAGAEQALDNMAAWAAPGGVLVLQVPDRQSVYGFITRLTPHRLHIWYYRHLLGQVHAGEPGRGPYPTVHDPIISRAGIRDWCRRNGFTVRREILVDGVGHRRGPAWTAIRVGIRVVAALSLGRLAHGHNNVAFVIDR